MKWAQTRLMVEPSLPPSSTGHTLEGKHMTVAGSTNAVNVPPPATADFHFSDFSGCMLLASFSQ